MKIGDIVYNRIDKKEYTVSDPGGDGNIIWMKDDTYKNIGICKPFDKSFFITKQELRKLKLQKILNHE